MFSAKYELIDFQKILAIGVDSDFAGAQDKVRSFLRDELLRFVRILCFFDE